MEQRTQIGYLVGGGLKENFRVRLTVSPQEIRRGRLWSFRADGGIIMGS